MKKQDIKNIDLSLRQFTFDFDTTGQKTDELVVKEIFSQLKVQGFAGIEDTLERLQQDHGLAPFDALQNMFWSAMERKIYFRSGKETLTPVQAKKILLQSEGPADLIITGNQRVETAVFNDMVLFIQSLPAALDGDILEPSKTDSLSIQYNFSVCLITCLKAWQSALNDFEPVAARTYFPDHDKIRAYLKLLTGLLARQDSHSIITACHENRPVLSRLNKDMGMLTEFYTRQARFWNTLVSAIDGFEHQILSPQENAHIPPDLKKDHPEISQDLKELRRIMQSPCPYDRVPEAKALFKRINRFNKAVEKEKLKARRNKGASQIDALIKTMISRFDRADVDPDKRNQHLYPVRLLKKQIHHAPSIPTVDVLVAQARDLAEDVL